MTTDRAESATPRIKVGGIIQNRELCLMGIMSAPDRPGVAAAIFDALGQARLNVQFIVQSIDLNCDSHVQFCLALEDVEPALQVLQPVAQVLGARRLIQNAPVSLLSVFGPDFRERYGIASAAFGALAQAGVNILAVSTSISTITCVVSGRDHDTALGALSAVFALP
jgi:aspartate kinase